MKINTAALLITLTALLTADHAAAAEVRSPQLTQAVRIASGTSSPDVSCETSDVAWDAEARAALSIPGRNLHGYTSYVTRKVRLAPWVCRNLEPASPSFGAALHVVAGEAGRVADVRDDGMNGCYGLMWAADLARRVWGIRFFTPASDRVIRQAVEAHRNLYAPNYRTVCR